jgi:excinuclease UvrABC nuclease subunit
MATAYKTRFVKPYKEKNGKFVVNLPTCSKCYESGVYLIKSDKTGKVIYIGYSATNLYKTITRHFQTWNDKQQNRFVYDKRYYTIRVIFTSSERSALLEKYLIEKYQPRDNKMKYDNYLSAKESNQAENIEQNAEFISVLEDAPF